MLRLSSAQVLDGGFEIGNWNWKIGICDFGYS